MEKKTKRSDPVSLQISINGKENASDLQKIVSALTSLGYTQDLIIKGSGRDLVSVVTNLGASATVSIQGKANDLVSAITKMKGNINPVSARISLRGGSTEE